MCAGPFGESAFQWNWDKTILKFNSFIGLPLQKAKRRRSFRTGSTHQVSGSEEGDDGEEEEEQRAPDVLDADDATFADVGHPDADPALVGEALPVLRHQPDEEEADLRFHLSHFQNMEIGLHDQLVP